jgi:ribokinase
MRPGWHVVCVGELMIDIMVRLPGPLAIGSDTAARIEFCGGGSAANTASWLVAAGTPSTLTARVGDPSDPLDAQAWDGLPAALSAGLIASPYRTGRCLVLIGPDGERTMAPDPGANAELRPDDLDPDAFRTGRHLHLSGYLLLGPTRPAAVRALSLARDARMTISVDASSAAPLAALGAAAFFDLVGSHLLLFANADEAAVLTEAADPFDGARLLADRCGEAVVKCGRAGAFWAAPGRSVHSPALAVEPVDTTGAGDAFTAGYLHAVGGGAAPADALGVGHRLARKACLRLGGRPAPAS